MSRIQNTSKSRKSMAAAKEKLFAALESEFARKGKGTLKDIEALEGELALRRAEIVARAEEAERLKYHANDISDLPAAMQKAIKKYSQAGRVYQFGGPRLTEKQLIKVAKRQENALKKMAIVLLASYDEDIAEYLRPTPIDIIQSLTRRLLNTKNRLNRRIVFNSLVTFIGFALASDDKEVLGTTGLWTNTQRLLASIRIYGPQTFGLLAKDLTTVGSLQRRIKEKMQPTKTVVDFEAALTQGIQETAPAQPALPEVSPLDVARASLVTLLSQKPEAPVIEAAPEPVAEEIAPPVAAAEPVAEEIAEEVPAEIPAAAPEPVEAPVAVSLEEKTGDADMPKKTVKSAAKKAARATTARRGRRPQPSIGKRAAAEPAAKAAPKPPAARPEEALPPEFATAFKDDIEDEDGGEETAEAQPVRAVRPLPRIAVSAASETNEFPQLREPRNLRLLANGLLDSFGRNEDKSLELLDYIRQSLVLMHNENLRRKNLVRLPSEDNDLRPPYSVLTFSLKGHKGSKAEEASIQTAIEAFTAYLKGEFAPYLAKLAADKAAAEKAALEAKNPAPKPSISDGPV